MPNSLSLFSCVRPPAYPRRPLLPTKPRVLPLLSLLAIQVQGPGAAAPAVNVGPAAAAAAPRAAAAAPPAPLAPPPPPPPPPLVPPLTSRELEALSARAFALVSRLASGHAPSAATVAETEAILLRPRGDGAAPGAAGDADAAAEAFADGWAAAVLGRDASSGALPAEPPALAGHVADAVAPLARLSHPALEALRARLATRVLNPLVQPPSAEGAAGAAAGTPPPPSPACLARLGEAFAALVAHRLLVAEGAVRSATRLLTNRRKRAGAVAMARGLLASPAATAQGGPLREPAALEALFELGAALEGRAAPAAARELAAAAAAAGGGAGLAAQQAEALMADLRAVAAGLAQLGVPITLPPPAAAPPPPPPPPPFAAAAAVAPPHAIASLSGHAPALPPATAGPGPLPPADAPPPATTRAFREVVSVAALTSGHGKTIFSLAVDPGMHGGDGVVISGGKDGIVAVWDGRALAAIAALRAPDEAAARAQVTPPRHRFLMEGMFAISVDVHAGRGVVLAAWNGDEDHPDVGGAVTVTDLTPGGEYRTV